MLLFFSIFIPALLELLDVGWKVNIRLVFIVTFDVFQVNQHVEAIGQDQQQDERGDEAHQDGWCQEGSAVTRRRKCTGADVEGLNLMKETKESQRQTSTGQFYPIEMAHPSMLKLDHHIKPAHTRTDVETKSHFISLLCTWKSVKVTAQRRAWAPLGASRALWRCRLLTWLQW